MSNNKRKLDVEAESEAMERMVTRYDDGLVNLMEAAFEMRRNAIGASQEAVSTSACSEVSRIGEGHFTLSRKLQRTILNVKEGSGYVRQYRKRHTNEERNLEQYMCQTCFNLQWSGRNLLEVPVVRVKDGKIVGNAHPVHDERCKAMKLEEAIAVAEDREGRLRVRQGLQKPRTAFEEAYKRCANVDAERYLPDWNRVKSAYYHHQVESKKGDSASPSKSRCLLKNDTVTLQRGERSNIKLGYDESRNKERECSSEKDYGIRNMEMDEVTSDFHDSVVQTTSTLEASLSNLSEGTLCELEMDDTNRILEDNVEGSSNPEEVSSSIDEALVETPPTNGIYNQNSHEKDEVAHLQPIQQANLTDNLRNDNQSESPTAEMLQSNQRPPYEEANFDTPSPSQSQLLPPIQSKSYDNNDNNQITTGKQLSKTINKISPQKRKSSNVLSEHFMKRDPRTGRIALCTRVPINEVLVPSSIKKPLLIEQQKYARKSSTPNALSKESTCGSFAAVVRSKPINCISNSCNISQRFIKKSRVKVKTEDNIIIVDDSAESSMGKDAAKVKDPIIRDDCDAIGRALANLIREVEDIDKYQGTELKIDILRTMNRYRNSVRYAQ